MSFPQSFFAERFGITEHDLESYLSEALSAGGDYADVYFQYLATSSLGIDEQIVKSATEGVSMGAGVRVIAGERTGYAYSDDLSPAKIRKAAPAPPSSPKAPPASSKPALKNPSSTTSTPCSTPPTKWVWSSESPSSNVPMKPL